MADQEEMERRVALAAYSAALDTLEAALLEARAANAALKPLEDVARVHFTGGDHSPALGIPGEGFMYPRLGLDLDNWRARVNKWRSERGYHVTPRSERGAPEDHPWGE